MSDRKPQTTPPIIGKHGTLADYAARGGRAHYVTETQPPMSPEDAWIERMARVLHNEFSRVNEPDANWSSQTDQQRERWRRSARVILREM